jgi:hypothetical protein
VTTSVLHPVFLTLGRILLGMAGCLFIYCSLFLYETEEGRLENVLERWWRRVRVLRTHAVSLETAFLKVVAEITSRGFSLLFGDRLFGAKAIAASFCYSVAAVSLVVLIEILLKSALFAEVYGSLTKDIFFQGGAFVFFVFLGSLGPFIHRQSAKLTWLAFVIMAIASLPIFYFGVLKRDEPLDEPTIRFVLQMGLIRQGFVLPLAMAFNSLFIVFTRTTLLRAAESSSFLKIVGYSVASALLAFAFYYVPNRCGLYAVERAANLKVSLIIGISLRTFGTANLFAGLVASAWLLVVAVMALQRLIWPVIERPIYALYRHKVLTKQKKLVFFTGVALVSIALPSVGRVLGALTKPLHL